MFKNLIEATQYFSDVERCNEYLVKMRWDGNITCPHCQHDKVYELKGANKRWKCAKCRKQFSATKGTIFENSPIPLQKWFVAVYLITTHKKGISSLQLGRDISVTQKTAWFMLQRIRHAYGLNETADLIGGEGVVVEVDETYIGGKVKNMSNRKRKAIYEAKERGMEVDNKTGVMGYIERSGKLRLQVMKQEIAINEYVTGNIDKESVLMTDAHLAYRKVGRHYKFHGFTDHSSNEYVKDKVIHTNTLEGAFSLFDRMIIGIYHNVSPKHLPKYLSEHTFRYNNRKDTEDIKFQKMLSCVNTRLTYQQLTKDE